MTQEKRNKTPGRAHAQLLDAAAALFYRDGIAATGIDAIVQQAGVAKKSLYNNFRSKAELVETYLRDRHQTWLGLYAARAAAATTPQARILAVFDAYVDHAGLSGPAGFRGCGQLNAAAELPSTDPQRAAVHRYKQEVEALVLAQTRLLWPAAPARAATVARHVAFLLEGAVVRAGLAGETTCLHEARAMAQALLESET